MVTVATKSSNKSMIDNLGKLYRANKKVVISVVFLALTAWAYTNPQGFLNLWLTRDQQGMILLDKNKAGKAALTFNDAQWVAYSFYADGNFEQAANLFEQFEGVEATFSQANSLAHIGQYFRAKELYQVVLNQQPNHTAASENLAIMNKVIKNLTKKPGKKVVSTDIAQNMKLNATTKKADEAPKVPTSNLWLEQVQQNPSKFLRKKFQQEHQNENK